MMKKTILTAALALFLLINSNGIHAQNTNPKLDQVDLIKRFIGNFKCEMAQDIVFNTEIIPYGTGGLEANQKTQYGDKVLSEEMSVWGYDKRSDKHICARISKGTPEIVLMAFWFTSKNTCEKLPFEFISNPEQASSKSVFEFKSNDLITITDFENNKPVRTYTWTRVKK